MYVEAIFIVLLAAFYSAAREANCDYVKYVEAGEKRYIYNKEYPHNFKSETHCRWIVTCPIGYNCRIDCNVNFSETASCSTHRLLISRIGDPEFKSSEYYCGHDLVTAVSVERTISVGLVSSVYSPGGRFLCVLVAQNDTVPVRKNYKTQYQ